MKIFVNIIFWIGFLFFGGGFLITFGKFIAYNGFGNIFEYVKPENIETAVEIDSLKKNKTIFYSYFVDSKTHSAKQTLYMPNIDKYNFYEGNIYYNKTIPSLSYIGNNKLRLRQEKVGMIISGFFFLLYFLIYKLANIDRMIAQYTGNTCRKKK